MVVPERAEGEGDVGETEEATGRLVILPTPADVELHDGSLAVEALAALTVSDETALPVAERFRRALALWGGPDLPAPRVADAAPGAVHLELHGGGTGGDSGSPVGDAARGEHELSVGEDGVRIAAAGLEGLHRGLSSLTQLLATANGTLRHCAVRDRARYGWRGLSLDVVRWFVPLDEVKRVIDLLSLYKLDVLHLHLTDNEGWRIEIRSWPALTGGSDADAGRSRSFYTQAELADLAAYAAERFVTLIPEIDLPGHAAAAIRAYPELGPAEGLTLEGPVPIAYLDAEAEPAQRFLEDVLREVAGLTPGPFLHIGGDEAFGMADAAHAGLVTRAAGIVRGLGKQVVGWQEASRADVGPGDTVQHWIDFVPGTTSRPEPDERRDEVASAIPAEVQATLDAFFRDAQQDLGRIVEKRTRVLLSPTAHAYLDRPHAEPSRDPEQEAARGRLGLPHYPPTPLRDYVEWDPAGTHPALDPALIVGVEGAVWGETITSEDDLEALLLPRLAGVAEVAWARPSADAWPGFRARLAEHARMWSRAGWNWFQAGSVDWAGPRTTRRSR